MPLDITLDEIEIQIRRDGKVVWVNGGDGLILRVCGLKKIHLVDERAKK